MASFSVFTHQTIVKILNDILKSSKHLFNFRSFCFIMSTESLIIKEAL